MNTTPFSSFQTCVSVQCSHSVVSDSFWPHGLHRPPCPSPTLGACSDSCPLSRWCHPTISSSVIPFPSSPIPFFILICPSFSLTSLSFFLFLTYVYIYHSLCSKSSVPFSRSVMSGSLQPHGLKHTRLPCPSPTLGVYSNSCPLNPCGFHPQSCLDRWEPNKGQGESSLWLLHCS